MSKSSKIAAALKSVEEAYKIYSAAQKEHKDKIDELSREKIVENDAYIKANNELRRLRLMESERDQLAKEIYVGLVIRSSDQSGMDNHFYDQALREANDFIKNKHGEEID